VSPRPPSLTSIATFEAAARHQSFAKAADELNLTQSAVSHAIRGLEVRLGSKLFERHGRGVLLTSEGRRFAVRVRLGINLLSEAFDLTPSLARSRLVLSVDPPFASRVVIPLLPRFRDAHPEIELDLQASSQVTGLSLKGGADIGLRYGPGGWAGLAAVKLSDGYLVPVVSPSWSGGYRVPADLAAEDLLGHVEFPWRLWFRAAGLDRPEPKCRFVFDNSILLLDAAVAGLGIALVRGLLAEADLRAGTLVSLFDVECQHNYSYWMVWNPASPKAEAIETFRVWLQEELRGEGTRK
jgi:LysR family glycine cleavage system transcriptional activator